MSVQRSSRITKATGTRDIIKPVKVRIVSQIFSLAGLRDAKLVNIIFLFKRCLHIHDCGTPAKETHRHLGKDLRGWGHKNILGHWEPTHVAADLLRTLPHFCMRRREYLLPGECLQRKKAKHCPSGNSHVLLQIALEPNFTFCRTFPHPRGTDYETTNIVRKKRKSCLEEKSTT